MLLLVLLWLVGIGDGNSRVGGGSFYTQAQIHRSDGGVVLVMVLLMPLVHICQMVMVMISIAFIVMMLCRGD